MSDRLLSDLKLLPRVVNNARLDVTLPREWFGTKTEEILAELREIAAEVEANDDP